MEKDTSGFTWFPTYTAAVQQLPDRLSKMQLVYAFFQYGEFGIEPEFIEHHVENGMSYISKLCPLFAAKAVFEANRVNLDNSRARHINGAKGAEHGKKGGRPRKGETAEEAYIRRQAEAAIDAYEPQQVPDDWYDYTEEFNPDIYCDLDVDIAEDLVA